MTEKRFECYDLIFDGFIKDTFTNENIVEPIKLIHLLNELFEEREYFERKKEYFLSKWSIAHAENIQLRQENKELKGKASSWKRTASEEILEKQDLLKQIVELKEENKKLKKSLLLKRKLENLDLNEKNDTVKMIDGKVFIKM